MSRQVENFFIRTAMRADIEAIRALLVETWHDTYDALFGAEKVTEITNSWHSVAALTARFEQPRSEFIVADSGRRIGGVAYAQARQDGKVVTLRQLYVLPGLQRQGIGNGLLDEIIVSYPEARAICLEVEKKNARAIAFYHAGGFHEVGRTADPAGFETLMLERDLPA